MSLVLDTGAMKYRENPSQPWRPLVIKAGMNWESMADTYDPDNGTYEVGQYVLEEGMMYRCIYEITTPEAWTPEHWTSANVADELASFIIISDDQPTEDSNKIWIAETTSPFGVQIPTMDDHNALGNTLNQFDQNMAYVESGNTASRNYSVGEFISWKGTLYTANGSISSGQSFSTGTGGNLAAVVGGGLNYFMEIETATTTPSTFVVQKIGKIVIVRSEQATISNSTVLIPSDFRPNGTVYGAAKYVLNSAWTEGWFRIFADGTVEILRNDGGILQGNVQCAFTVAYFTS